MNWIVDVSKSRDADLESHAGVPVWAILGGLLASVDVVAAISALIAQG